MYEGSEDKKRYLRRYLEAEQLVRCLEEDLERERAAFLLRSQAYDDMPHSSGTNGADLANMAAKLDEILMEIRRELDRKHAIRKEILRRMRKMQNEREECVLYYRYIIGLKWEEIAERMGYEERWIYKIHGSALQQF